MDQPNQAVNALTPDPEAAIKPTLAARIASRILARENCLKSGNDEWYRKHAEALTELLRHLPSGSGFNNGTQLDEPKCDGRTLVFTTAFHHMDENGFYDGWTEHTVRVHATFDGIELGISGPNRNDIKDVIFDRFYYALMERE